MARSRNIKPGFFTNDVLGELAPLTRLLFAGLWTICDRDGRVEDRPKKIRAEVLPYDVCDAEEMLEALEKHGFIARYKASGIRVIQVLAWDKHQNPHVKESLSLLPPPDGIHPLQEEAPYKNSASTGQEQGKLQPLPALAGLIPDSLLLIPDSLVNTEAKASSPSAQLPDCPHELLIDLFEKQLPNLAQPKKSLWRAGKNAPAMKARWRWVLTATHEKGERKGQRLATTKDDGIAWFERYFTHVARSEFLTGASGDWACDLGWLINAANFEKVLSGNYDNKGAS